MIAETHLQSSVDKLGDYLSYGRNANANKVADRSERVGWEAGRNLGVNPTMAEAKAAIKGTASRSRVEKPIYQIIISWQSGNDEQNVPPDNPSREEMEWTVDQVREELGLEEHYAWMVGHVDTDTPHVHVVIGTVNPRTGETWSNFRAKKDIYNKLREIEEEKGWHRPGPMTIEEKWEQETAESEEYWEETHEKWDRERSVRVWAREEGIADDIKEATSWEEVEEALKGTLGKLEARRDRGMVLKRGEEHAAMSAIDAAISRPKLEERFGRTWEEYQRRQREKRASRDSGRGGTGVSGDRETMQTRKHNGIGSGRIKNSRKAPPRKVKEGSDRDRPDLEEAGRPGVHRLLRRQDRATVIWQGGVTLVTLNSDNVSKIMPHSEEELSARELNQVRKKVEGLRKIEESREESSNTSSNQPEGGSVEERIENRYGSYQDLKRSVGREINGMSDADKARLANQLNEEGQEVVDRATTFQRNEEIYELASKFYQERYQELPAESPKRKYIEKRTHGLGEDMEIGHAPNDWHAFENYAKERGYTDEDLLEAGMVRERADGEGVYDTMKNSVVAFSRNEDGQVRKISFRWNEGTKNPKMDPPNFKKMTIGRGEENVEAHEPSEAVFGWEEAQSTEGDEVLVTEGFSDAAAARSAGYNAVAVGGRNITEEKADIINTVADTEAAEVTVMLDGDDAGRVGSIEVVQEMERRGASVDVVRPPEDADIDEMVVDEGEEAVETYIENNRVDGLEYVYENAATMNGEPTEELGPAERASRMERAVDVATSAPTPERREQNFERLVEMRGGGGSHLLRQGFEDKLEEKGLTQPTWTEYSEEGRSETREETGGATRRLAGSGDAEEPVQSSLPESAEEIREEMYVGEESSEPALEAVEGSASDQTQASAPEESSESEVEGAEESGPEPEEEVIEGESEATEQRETTVEGQGAVEEARDLETGDTSDESARAEDADQGAPIPDALRGEDDDIQAIREEWSEVTERLNQERSQEEAKRELVGENGSNLSETYVEHLDRPQATTAGGLSRRGQNEGGGESRSAQPPGYYSEETPQGREMQDKIVGAEGIEDRIRERDDLQGQTMKGRIETTEDGNLQISRISKERTSFGEKGGMPDVPEEDVDIIVAEVRSDGENELYALPASTRDRVKVPEAAFRQTNREEDREARIERLQSQDEQRAFEARTRHIGRSSRAKLFDQAGTSGDEESMVSVPRDAPDEDRLKVAADVNFDAVRNAEVTDGEYREVERMGGQYETSRSETPIEFELGDDPEGIYENGIEEIDVEQPGKFADENGEFSYPSERGHYYGSTGHSMEEFEEFADNELRERWSEILKEEYVEDLETSIREEMEEKGVRDEIEASVREEVEFDIDEELREEYREKVQSVKAEVESEFDREISEEELNEQLDNVEFREEIEEVRGALESERRDPEAVVEERVEKEFNERVARRVEERLDGEDLDRRVRGDLDRIIDEKVEEFEPLDDVEREGFEGPQDDLDRQNVGDVIPAEVDEVEGEADYEVVRQGAIKTGSPEETEIDAEAILEERLKEEQVALEYRAKTLREVRDDLSAVEDLEVSRATEQSAPQAEMQEESARSADEEARESVDEEEALGQEPSGERVRWDEVEETLETREDLVRRQEMGGADDDLEWQLEAVNARLDEQLRGVGTDVLRQRYVDTNREVADRRRQQSALNAEQEETARDIGDRNEEIRQALESGTSTTDEGRTLDEAVEERNELTERTETLLEEQNELIREENRSERVARGYRRELNRRGAAPGEEGREAEVEALEADLKETWTARNASARVEQVSEEGRDVFEEWNRQTNEGAIEDPDVDLYKAIEEEEERRDRFESIRDLENNALEEKEQRVESNDRAAVPEAIREGSGARRAESVDPRDEQQEGAQAKEGERDRMAEVGEYVRERSKVSGEDTEIMDRQVDIDEVKAYRRDVSSQLQEAQSKAVEANRRIGEINNDLRKASERLEEAAENGNSAEAAAAYGDIEEALDRREETAARLATADQNRRELRDQAYRAEEVLSQRQGAVDDESVRLGRAEAHQRSEIEYERSRRLDQQSTIDNEAAGRVSEYAVNDEVDANLEERLRTSASESKTQSLRAEERRVTASNEFQRQQDRAQRRDVPEIDVREEAIASNKDEEEVRSGGAAAQEGVTDGPRETVRSDDASAEGPAEETRAGAESANAPREGEESAGTEGPVEIDGVDEYVDRRREATADQKEELDRQVDPDDLYVHRAAIDDQLTEVQQKAREENRQVGEINKDLEAAADQLRTAVEDGDERAAAEAYSEVKYALERRQYAEDRMEAANRARNDLSKEAHDVNQILSERTGGVDDEAVALGQKQSQNRVEIETEQARRLEQQSEVDKEAAASVQAYRRALDEGLTRPEQDNSEGEALDAELAKQEERLATDAESSHQRREGAEARVNKAQDRLRGFQQIAEKRGLEVRDPFEEEPKGGEEPADEAERGADAIQYPTESLGAGEVERRRQQLVEERESLEAKVQETREEANQIGKQRQALANQLQENLEGDADLTTEEVSRRKAEIESLKEEFQARRSEIEQVQRKIESINEEIEVLDEEIASREVEDEQEETEQRTTPEAEEQVSRDVERDGEEQPVASDLEKTSAIREEKNRLEAIQEEYSDEAKTQADYIEKGNAELKRRAIRMREMVKAGASTSQIERLKDEFEQRRGINNKAEKELADNRREIQRTETQIARLEEVLEERGEMKTEDYEARARRLERQQDAASQLGTIEGQRREIADRTAEAMKRLRERVEQEPDRDSPESFDTQEERERYDAIGGRAAVAEEGFEEQRRQTERRAENARTEAEGEGKVEDTVVGESAARTKAKEDLATVRENEELADEAFTEVFENGDRARGKFEEEAYVEGVDARTSSYKDATERLVRSPERYGQPKVSNEWDDARQEERMDLERAAARQEAATRSRQEFRSKYGRKPEEMADLLGEDTETLEARDVDIATPQAREQAAKELRQQEERRAETLEENFLDTAAEKFDRPDRAVEAYEENTTMYGEQTAREALKTPVAYKGQDKAFADPGGAIGGSETVQETLEDLDREIREAERRIDGYRDIEETARRQEAERVSREPVAEVEEEEQLEQTTWDQIQGPSTARDRNTPSPDEVKRAKEVFQDQVEGQRAEQEVEEVLDLVDTAESRREAEEIERHIYESGRPANKRGAQSLNDEAERLNRTLEDAYQSPREGQEAAQLIRQDMRGTGERIKQLADDDNAPQEVRNAADAIREIEETRDEVTEADMLEAGVRRDNDVLKQTARWKIKKAERESRLAGDRVSQTGPTEAEETMNRVEKTLNAAREERMTTAEPEGVEEQIRERVEAMSPEAESELRDRADTDPRAEEALAVERRRRGDTDIGTPDMGPDRGSSESDGEEPTRERESPSQERSRGRAR